MHGDLEFLAKKKERGKAALSTSHSQPSHVLQIMIGPSDTAGIRSPGYDRAFRLRREAVTAPTPKKTSTKVPGSGTGTTLATV